MPRPSPVRDAVEELVGSGRRHDWSIDELAEALAERGIAADFSSVFRAVARLERDGALRRTALGDGKARYEAAEEHHDHIRCVSCGAVDAVPGCVLEQTRSRVERETGFRVTGHELLFEGLCAGCGGGG